jgi:hypothetical protein
MQTSLHVLRNRQSVWIYAIALLSILLNVAGNKWGAPQRWHPDELTERADALWGGRTLNPHFFPYGGLGFYVFTGGAVLPVRLYERLFDQRPGTEDTVAKRLWSARDSVRVMRAARTISAVLGTLVVIMTYLIGVIVYDPPVGALAALLTAVAGSGIVVAHLATVDTSANFWYWAAALATLGVWKSGQAWWYVAAGLLVGIAAGVKVDRAMVLIPLLVAHFLRRDTSVKYLAVAMAAAPVGFIAANPVSLVAPFEFLDGFARDFFFQLVRPPVGGATSSYLLFPDLMRIELGWPLMMSAVAAVLYALREALARRRPRETLWLFATFVPYYVILGPAQLSPWYVHLLVPPMMLLTAAAFVAAVRSARRSVRGLAATVLILVVAAAQVNSLGYVLEFARDARYEAAIWAAGNVPAGAIIATSIRGPLMPDTARDAIEIMPDQEGYAFAPELSARLEANRPYRVVRSAIFRVEAWVDRRRGVSLQRAPYKAWFDFVREEYGPSTAGLQSVRPDYLFLNDTNALLIERLRRDDLGYRLVGQMHPPGPFHSRAAFAFLNQSVYVFRRDSASAVEFRVSDGTMR